MYNLRPIIHQDKNVIIGEYGKKFWDYIDEEIGTKNISLWENFIKMFLDQIKFGTHVLDYGCGFGIESILLSHKIKRITAIDLDKEKISIFNKLLSRINIRNIKALVANGQDTPFKDNSFDTVFCNESLSHVSDIKLALKEIKRILKKGGQIIIADTKRWNPYGIWMIYIRGDYEENYFNTWTMKRLLKETGFVNIQKIKYITCPRDPFIKYRKAIWPILEIIEPKYVYTALK
jgi:ubiquinone/menaquinone biosynthesis C-methylase UbiE